MTKHEVAAILLSAVASWSAVSAQFVPLHGSCASSVQCVSVAICVRAVCSCPIGYVPLGLSCGFTSVSVGAGVEQGFIAPAPLTPPGYPPAAPHPIPIPPIPPPVAVVPVLPGLPCMATSVCGGGAFCYSGSCNCPMGMMVSGSSCVTQTQTIAGPGGFATATSTSCATGQVFIGGSCMPGPLGLGGIGFGGAAFGLGVGGGVGIGGPIGFGGCGMGCGVGGFCGHGGCSCHSGYVLSAGACVVQTAIAAPIPAFPVFPPPMAIAPPVALVRPGLPCMAHTQCITGAFCVQSACACRSTFFQLGGICLAKKRASSDAAGSEHERNSKVKAEGLLENASTLQDDAKIEVEALAVQTRRRL